MDNQNVPELSTLFQHSPNHSPIPASVKKIIPAKMSTNLILICSRCCQKWFSNKGLWLNAYLMISQGQLRDTHCLLTDLCWTNSQLHGYLISNFGEDF